MQQPTLPFSSIVQAGTYGKQDAGTLNFDGATLSFDGGDASFKLPVSQIDFVDFSDFAMVIYANSTVYTVMHQSMGEIMGASLATIPTPLQGLFFLFIRKSLQGSRAWLEVLNGHVPITGGAGGYTAFKDGGWLTTSFGLILLGSVPAILAQGGPYALLIFQLAILGIGLLMLLVARGHFYVKSQLPVIRRPRYHFIWPIALAVTVYPALCNLVIFRDATHNLGVAYGAVLITILQLLVTKWIIGKAAPDIQHYASQDAEQKGGGRARLIGVGIFVLVVYYGFATASAIQTLHR